MKKLCIICIKSWFSEKVKKIEIMSRVVYTTNSKGPKTIVGEHHVSTYERKKKIVITFNTKKRDDKTIYTVFLEILTLERFLTL